MNIKATGCCLVSIEQMTSLFHKVLFMQKSTKLLFITLVPTLLMTNSYASEQSEVKVYRWCGRFNTLSYRIKHSWQKNAKADQNSAVQGTILKLDSGFTQGTFGFDVGVLTDTGFKIVDNSNAGVDMIPSGNRGASDVFGHVTPKDHWLRGGRYVKAHKLQLLLYLQAI